MGYIYRLKNKINGKIYFGQTTRPIKERLKEHRYGKSKGCRGIYNAIKKYEWENFDIYWYDCPNEDLNDHEEFLIRVLETLSPNGYNLQEGGDNRKTSEETKKKQSRARLGTTRSEETKQKHSESTKGEKHHRSKRVYQYDLDGNFINSFGSCGEAERYLEKNGTSIRTCGRGKNKTAYGFKWSYNMNIFI